MRGKLFPRPESFGCKTKKPKLKAGKRFLLWLSWEYQLRPRTLRLGTHATDIAKKSSRLIERRRISAEKGPIFSRALHARNRAFIIPNPWDVGRRES